MPTKHRRHAITETGAVAEALAELRRTVGEDGFTLSELVVLGAQRRLFDAELERASDVKARAAFAAEIRAGHMPAVDIAAADEVRRTGWARPQ
jgi:hypothetical protein